MSPAIVLVPGLCSVASTLYAPLISRLNEIDVDEVHPVNLPSADPSEALKPNALEADIKAIRARVVKLIEGGQDVILIGHSYGGTPCLCAAEGLWKKEAGKDEREIWRILLISSSFCLPGRSVTQDRMEYSQGQDNEGEIDDDGAKFEMTDIGMTVEVDGRQFFTDMSDEEAEKWKGTLKPSPLDSAMSPAPETNTRSWRVSCLITEKDPAMTVAFQEHLVERAKAAGAEMEVIRMASGHFPHLSRAAEVAQWIEGFCA